MYNTHISCRARPCTHGWMKTYNINCGRSSMSRRHSCRAQPPVVMNGCMQVPGVNPWMPIVCEHGVYPHTVIPYYEQLWLPGPEICLQFTLDGLKRRCAWCLQGKSSGTISKSKTTSTSSKMITFSKGPRVSHRRTLELGFKGQREGRERDEEGSKKSGRVVWHRYVVYFICNKLNDV